MERVTFADMSSVAQSHFEHDDAKFHFCTTDQKKDAPVNWKDEGSEGFAECRVSAAVRF
jgi:hypothetical protein